MSSVSFRVRGNCPIVTSFIGRREKEKYFSPSFSLDVAVSGATVVRDRERVREPNGLKMIDDNF